jgi:4,5-dihydroxyphthalate decarboxylase
MERTRATMGTDYWPYGFTRARPEIAAMCRHSVDQFLAPRLVAPEELFEPSLLGT